MSVGGWRSRSNDWFETCGGADNERESVQTYADYLKWDEFSTLRLHESVTVAFKEDGSLGIKVGVERGDEKDAPTIHYIQGLNNTDDQGNARQLDALAQLRVGDVLTNVNGTSIVQLDTREVMGLLKNPVRPIEITVMRHNNKFQRAVEEGDKGFAADIVVVRKDVARYVPTTVSPDDLRDLVFFEHEKEGSGAASSPKSVGDISTTDDEASITDDDLLLSGRDDADGRARRRNRSRSSVELLSDSESCSSEDPSTGEDDMLGDALSGGGALGAGIMASAGTDTGGAASSSSFDRDAKTVRRVQRRLTNVLMAVTRRLQQTSGYAQGMHSIVALLLGAGLSEERAFWVMATIVERLCERGFYASSAGKRVQVSYGHFVAFLLLGFGCLRVPVLHTTNTSALYALF